MYVLVVVEGLFDKVILKWMPEGSEGVLWEGYLGERHSGQNEEQVQKL